MISEKDGACKVLQVIQQMDDLSIQVERCEHLGKAFRERLNRVIYSVPRVATSGPDEAEPSLAPLPAEIRLLSRRIRATCDQFDDILQTLEV